jgi:hypothetical protein
LILADFKTTKTTVNLVLPDGAYNWTPIVPTGYTSSPGGSFTVAEAKPVAVTVPYAAPETATFTFSESGLASGLPWQVTVGTALQQLTTNGGTDTLTWTGLAAGSYPYSITPIPGWGQATLPYSGTVTGGAVTEPTLGYTQTTYPVTFSESGLPTGSAWQLSLDGIPMSSTTTSMSDSLTWTTVPNGTYSYSITGNSGWTQSTLAYSGTVVVNGNSVTEPTLVYTQVTYALTISESGLGSNQVWTVRVNGMKESLTTNTMTDTLTFAGVANGTYSYTITPSPGWHQSTLPYSGKLVVNGGTGSISGTGIGYAVTLAYTQVTYSVTFSESGLPSSVTWQVTVDGMIQTVTPNGGTESLTWTGLPNGTYAYSIAAISGWHQSTLAYAGNVVVNGASVTEPTLAYSHLTYSVTFWEFLLGCGQTWKVTVNGVTKSLTANGLFGWLNFTGLANGTYSYSIAANPGWHQNVLPYSGSVVVKGSSVTESLLLYLVVTYTVTFSESGLPSGLSWTVTVAGSTRTLTTNGGTDTLKWTGLANGTYSYSITGNPGWHQGTLAYSGKITVNGGTNSISGSGIGYAETLAYSRVTYSVTFSESGLPSGLTWSVTVNGVTEKLTTNGGTDSLTWTGLANGTYAYSIASISGEHQSTLPSSGNVVVKGASVSESTLKYT